MQANLDCLVISSETLGKFSRKMGQWRKRVKPSNMWGSLTPYGVSTLCCEGIEQGLQQPYPTVTLGARSGQSLRQSGCHPRLRSVQGRSRRRPVLTTCQHVLNTQGQMRKWPWGKAEVSGFCFLFLFLMNMTKKIQLTCFLNCFVVFLLSQVGGDLSYIICLHLSLVPRK